MEEDNHYRSCVITREMSILLNMCAPFSKSENFMELLVDVFIMYILAYILLKFFKLPLRFFINAQLFSLPNSVRPSARTHTRISCDVSPNMTRAKTAEPTLHEPTRSRIMGRTTCTCVHST